MCCPISYIHVVVDRRQAFYLAELRALFKTVHAIHGENDRDSINPSPTIPGTAFVALRMFTEHSVAPHPAEPRAHFSIEHVKTEHI